MIDVGYSLLVIAAIALTTIVLRAAPFVLFPADRSTPGYVVYLGTVLPPAIMAMLVVYCLKGVNLSFFPFGLPEFLALAAVAGLHLWKKNTLLSIGLGTVLYMVLVQFVFVT